VFFWYPVLDEGLNIIPSVLDWFWISKPLTQLPLHSLSSKYEYSSPALLTQLYPFQSPNMFNIRRTGWSRRKRRRLVLGRWSIRILAGTAAILAEAFHGFPQFLKANSGIVPRLGHDSFLPSFQILSSSSIIRLYVILVLKALLNNPRKNRVSIHTSQLGLLLMYLQLHKQLGNILAGWAVRSSWRNRLLHAVRYRR
jgi:hypothetical protein